MGTLLQHPAVSLAVTPTPVEAPSNKGPVVYWMSRDQRIFDNRALEFSLHLAVTHSRGLVVCYCLVSSFLGATLRGYDFLLGGLQEVELELMDRGIPFLLLRGDPKIKIPQFLKDAEACVCVTDFDPFRIKREWKQEVIRSVTIPLYEVDAHNIVPCREASAKQEYSARTIRPKINSKVAQYLQEKPWIDPEDWKKAANLSKSSRIDTHQTPMLKDKQEIIRSLSIDPTVPPVDWLTPGTGAARKVLQDFITYKLTGYGNNRNDPNKDSQSDLSPYLHFGQISAREVVAAVQNSKAPLEDTEAFVEQVVVRKELSDNYCYYNPHYDSMLGFPAWAQQSLRKHAGDPRDYLYSCQQLDRSQTHDPLWNAAQKQLVCQGKLHGYLRMYWAKKILEWTSSPEVALEYALQLNNRYNLDGRDPNGYVGCAWSIGGLHDRPWFERPIYGEVRYMNYAGAARKFDVEAFISKWGNRTSALS